MFAYLASPYSHADHNVMEERYLRNVEACADLTRNYITCYSPIVHFHQVAKLHDMRTDFFFWQQHNENMLRKAERLYVLTLPGWDISRGVNWELGFARALRLEALFVHPITFKCATNLADLGL